MRLFVPFLGLLLGCANAWALGGPRYVSDTAQPGAFPLVEGPNAAALRVDSTDWPGVLRAARDLQADINRVTSLTPALVNDLHPRMVLIGTIGRSTLIDRLAQEGKIDVGEIRGKWESFSLQTVANPLPGVDSALVIAGSDKRGTIFGIYDLSEQIGVSPWYWWADVTPEHRGALYVTAGEHQQGEPSVKYRGIFLNDEKPDLDFWVRSKFGEHPAPGGGSGTVANFNSQFYTKLFEVILRMKGNYLWPAMWNNAFAEDDPSNARLADEYGIVMGTSHQEPMMRAQKEWDWHLRDANGNWNYATHPAVLDQFWRSGIRERKDFENIYTMGLRGENDSAMVGTAAEGVALTEKIVAEQRKMLAEEVNPKVENIPQMWSLYKEVQGYYESGLRVPGDVTLLWAEDNWGNIRRLPTPEERQRSGGAGIYYHFDYHGGPRSYQWLNTSPLPKIWEQMSLAKQYGADRIWIVNVGHFKGYELPTEYFLSLGWNTGRWTGENVNEFTLLWAAREFGDAYANEAAGIVAAYTKYNGRRKPELLEAGTYSLTNYQEADRVAADYNALVARAEALSQKLPAPKRDAFYQLVLFPTKASANLNEMYIAAAMNALYAKQGRASANDWATRTQVLFQKDQDLMRQFNKELAGGKWDHFMDQSHIGYTTWRDPPADTMEAIKLTQITIPTQAGLGIAATLPLFDSMNDQHNFIDIYNRGLTAFTFTAAASQPWIVLSQTSGAVEKETRISVSIDWKRAPAGLTQASIKIAGAGREEIVDISTRKVSEVTTGAGFAEGDGYVAMEAEHFSRATSIGSNRWVRVEDYGHTLSGMRTSAPVDTPSLTPGQDAPVLEYRMYLFTPGQTTVRLTLGPALNFAPSRSVKLAVSFDDEEPQIQTVVPQGYNAQNGNRDWEQSVRDNARFVTSTHAIVSRGSHTLKVWMVDPGVVLERILVDTPASSKATSYLGPPESWKAPFIFN
ncbi:MAG: glycosyl hydrolase 115 family protein [Acidobacteriota bacterium]